MSWEGGSYQATMTKLDVYESDLTGERFDSENKVAQFRIATPYHPPVALHGHKKQVPKNAVYNGQGIEMVSDEWCVMFEAYADRDLIEEKNKFVRPHITDGFRPGPNVIGVGKSVTLNHDEEYDSVQEIVQLSTVGDELQDFAGIVESQIGPKIGEYF